MFLFNETLTTELYKYRHTLALPDSLPIFREDAARGARGHRGGGRVVGGRGLRQHAADQRQSGGAIAGMGEIGGHQIGLEAEILGRGQRAAAEGIDTRAEAGADRKSVV